MGEDRTPPEQGQDPPERETEPPTVHVRRRLTVSQAAEELGISAEAVRSRVKRGTLRSTKEDGTVYVLRPGRLDDDQTRPGGDQSETEHGQTSARTEAQGDLVESLLDQVAYMREQLAEEREARRRADTIIAQLSQANAALARRVPEIEAPEPRGAPENAGEPRPGTDAPAGDTEQPRVSWWRRFFGLE